MNTPPVTVEVWSDMVCPFCYVGKKKLERAIAKLRAADRVQIIWHSFQLDPDFPAQTSVNATAYLVQRKGLHPDQMQGMYRQLEQLGSQYGIEFHFDKSLSFNTFDAHRLWHWSRTQGKENQWKEAIMYAYFTEGRDLSKPDALADIALAIGLDRTAALQVLADPEQYAEAVQHDIYQSRTIGIQGVPFFLVNGKATISGAQDDRVFDRVLEAALH